MLNNDAHHQSIRLRCLCARHPGASQPTGDGPATELRRTAQHNRVATRLVSHSAAVRRCHAAVGAERQLAQSGPCQQSGADGGGADRPDATTRLPAVGSSNFGVSTCLSCANVLKYAIPFVDRTLQRCAIAVRCRPPFSWRRKRFSRPRSRTWRRRGGKRRWTARRLRSLFMTWTRDRYVRRSGELCCVAIRRIKRIEVSVPNMFSYVIYLGIYVYGFSVEDFALIVCSLPSFTFRQQKHPLIGLVLPQPTIHTFAKPV